MSKGSTSVENWFLASYCPSWPPKYLDEAWEAEWCVLKVCTTLTELSWPRVHLCRRTTKDENVVIGKVVGYHSKNKIWVATEEKDLNEAKKTAYT
jgi:hypothetical protein